MIDEKKSGAEPGQYDESTNRPAQESVTNDPARRPGAPGVGELPPGPDGLKESGSRSGKGGGNRPNEGPGGQYTKK